jgi:hypothetical protein
MNPADFPAPALVELADGEGFAPVEAPACGERLDLDDHGIHLRCDQVKGHGSRDNTFTGRHRQVLPGGHPVWWCDDGCAHVCSGPLSALHILRQASKENPS